MNIEGTASIPLFGKSLVRRSYLSRAGRVTNSENTIQVVFTLGRLDQHEHYHDTVDKKYGERSLTFHFILDLIS